MRIVKWYIIAVIWLCLSTFTVEAVGGGPGSSGGGSSGSSVPFLHPLLNIILFVVISFFIQRRNK